ncbi:MAG: twin-arginine translocase subunit TatC [Planctomycetaceae bacterium]|jgi:sec-independent protein translocase protein TatC|nr:twin-arginine translocase subunit TatC [Planctomycetaceae bacterium]
MAKHPKEDLFSESTMSFGDHLEELRQCLFRGMIGLLVGVGVGIFLAKDIVKEIQMPLKEALREYYQQRSFDLVRTDSFRLAETAGMIGDEGYSADTMEIEIDQLFINLRQSMPELFGALQYKSYMFVEQDFLIEDGGESNHLLFLQHIQSHAKQEWAKYLLAKLPEELRKSFNKSAQLADGDVEVGVSAVAVVEFLNVWANVPDLFENESLRELVQEKVERKTSSWMDFGLENADENAIDVAKVFAVLEQQVQRESTTVARQDAIRRVNKFIITNAFSEYLRSARPVTITVPVWEKVDVRVQTLNAHEGFMIWIKAAFIGGIILSSPWLFYQIWQFIAAGLYPHERKYVYIYLPFSLLLFFGGAAMAFFVVMEPVLDFLFSYNRMMEIDPDPRISEWLGFVMFLPLGFGIAFQLPLVMLMLQRIGIFTIEAYLAKWRVAVLIIFIASMFLTPADPLSMLMLAGPLTILYFFGITLCRFMPRNRNPYADGYDPA